MPNIDAPIGLWPISPKARITEYVLTTGATVYKGDVVKIVAAGTVETAAADIGIAAIGVAAEYKSDAGSAGGIKILVYDDPDTEFGIQSDTDTTGIVAADVGASSNHVATHSGSTTTYLSGHELVATPSGGQFIIKRRCDSRKPNNAWGPNADVVVVFAEHMYRAALTGV